MQTDDYARALIAVEPGIKHDALEDQVALRMERQAILERDDAPQMWSVIDESVLHRGIGGAKVMRAQLEHIAHLYEHPNISVQVIPASTGAHAGLLGHFVIADLDGSPGMVYLETAAEGMPTDSPSILAHVMLRFDSLRSEALPRAASRDLIMKVAEEKWT